MDRAVHILIAAFVFIFLWGSCAAAQKVGEESSQDSSRIQIRVGITRCYESRSMHEIFNAVQEKIEVLTIHLPRNPLDAVKVPLPRTAQDIPDVLIMTLGRYSDDLVQMADLGLIEPVDSLLAELGLTADDMLPSAREAVTYRGRIWGLPWHAIMHTLVSHRILLPKDAPRDSWESLLDSAAKNAEASSEAAKVISIPISDFRLAEQMATSAGGEAFTCGNPRVLISDPYLKAFRLIAQYKAQGQVATRMENTPMKKGDLALLGEAYLDSIYEGNEYGVIPLPVKLMKKDAATKVPHVPALLEVFAVKANNPASREAVKEYLRWMMKPETHWMVFQATNDVIQTKEWTLDSVHVPLWESLLGAPLFKSALEDFQDYAALVENVRHMHIARSVPKLDEALTLQAEEYVYAHLGQPDFEKGLAALVESFEAQILQTPVESHTYDAF